jgi:hypothetical protein
MQLIRRWWNGSFGRLARRDLWLETGTIWRVRARHGDGDSPTKTWTYDSHDQAEAMIRRLIDAQPGDWRDITEISTTSLGKETRPRPRPT